MGRAANHLARFQGKRPQFPQWSGRLILHLFHPKLTDGPCVSMALLIERGPATLQRYVPSGVRHAFRRLMIMLMPVIAMTGHPQ